MNYSIYKTKGAWRLARIINSKPHEIANFKSKKEAILTARLLAGPLGSITIL